jgi:hypothetical protein
MPVISSLPIGLPFPKYGPPPPDDADIGSPLWWVHRLANRLSLEQSGFVTVTADATYVLRVGTARLDRYVRGDFDLPWVPDAQVAAEYRAMLERSRSNFMRLVVSNAAERSRPLGLRFPDDQETADTESWDIWQRNDMDAQFPVAVETALAQRKAYWSVWRCIGSCGIVTSVAARSDGVNVNHRKRTRLVLCR